MVTKTFNIMSWNLVFITFKDSGVISPCLVIQHLHIQLGGLRVQCGLHVDSGERTPPGTNT